MKYSEICLDLSVPLNKRLDSLQYLTVDEIDNLIECICSVYNIHPTYSCLQYLQRLILHNKPCLKRRIRIAETCDLGRTVLYLLTRIRNISERISCIEMFSNPYLKFHAYCALYNITDIKQHIQIMKNCFRLPHIKNKSAYLKWFETQLDDCIMSYKYRAICADFLIINTKPSDLMYKKAREFLKLNGEILNYYDHMENVHLFTPKPYVLEQILSDPTIKRADIYDIVKFILDKKSNLKVFQDRILNDKTLVGNIKLSCTLETLICCVWPKLTDDLRFILIDDIDSSDNSDESGWACTTGYYNRIINVYQAIRDNQLLYETSKLEEDEFIEWFISQINSYIKTDSQMDDILNSITEDHDKNRILYLTFKVKTLPKLTTDAKNKYKHLPQYIFDEYFSKALRTYEFAL